MTWGSFGTLDSNEKTVAILQEIRWWPHAEKQDGEETSKEKSFDVIYGKRRSKRPNVGGVSIGSRNAAPSRKGCLVNGQMAKASNKRLRLERDARSTVE